LNPYTFKEHDIFKYITQMELLAPVLETAVVIASHYCKACGRNTVTAEDMRMGMKFAARRVPGVENESLFPEIYDSEESDESDIEVVDEDDEPFTRYVGTDPNMLLVNEMTDTWDEWEPDTPIQELLKRSIDSHAL
jgi:hypothetical protein